MLEKKVLPNRFGLVSNRTPLYWKQTLTEFDQDAKIVFDGHLMEFHLINNIKTIFCYNRLWITWKL